jgi:4-diphosphocytidyl-2-C-methyl-D-erythritol kinase
MYAPAKLTLSLAVTGVRPDGYHELRAEMVALSLADELIITEGGHGVTVAAEPWIRAEALDVDGDNLITRALASVGRTAAVEVTKHIPLGGGLGGGSSDAAAVLRWAGSHDVGTALSLGSDVPFSLAGGRALVEGVGEKITPLPYEFREVVLLIPPFGVDTAKVYAAWDARRSRAELEQGPNELTESALEVEPRLATWRDVLADLTGVEPVLAGSGSTWFVDALATQAQIEDSGWLTAGADQARIMKAHTVPEGWNGS